MNRTLSLVAVAVLVLVAVAGATGAAATDTPTPTETPTPTATPTASSATVVEEVDSRLRVTGYEYRAEGDVFLVELENTGTTVSHVTITEAISRRNAEEGRFGIETFRVSPDEDLTVRVTMYTSNPLGVMVTTEESVEQGHGTFLATDTGGGGLFQGPATWTTVRAGATAGIFATLMLMVGFAWHRVATETDDVEPVDLEPDERRWRR